MACAQQFGLLCLSLPFGHPFLRRIQGKQRNPPCVSRTMIWEGLFTAKVCKRPTRRTTIADCWDLAWLRQRPLRAPKEQQENLNDGSANKKHFSRLKICFLRSLSLACRPRGNCKYAGPYKYKCQHSSPNAHQGKILERLANDDRHHEQGHQDHLDYRDDHRDRNPPPTLPSML